jgi:hypothetical protein
VQFTGCRSGCGRIGLRAKVSLGETSVDVSRADAIHPDSILSVIDRHCLCQANNSGFRGAIAGTTRLYEVRIYRSHVDDASLRTAKKRQKEFRAQEGSADIHSELAIPFRNLSFFDCLIHLDGRIVDEDMNLRELEQSLVSELRH